MSSDFTVPLCSSLPDANDYTNKIHDVFNQHWITLNNERQASIDKIDQWRRDCKEYINRHANEQKVLINEHYNRLRSMFDEKHTENLETANAYYPTRQVDLLNELHKECQSLKFSKVIVQFSKYEIDRPELVSVEAPRETKTSEEMNTARRRRRQNKVNGNNTENTGDARTSSPTYPATSNSKQSDDQQSSKINSKKKNAQSTTNIDDLKNEGLNDNRSDNKCPICFMIFPLNMTRDNRQQHVNEHYTDD